MMRTALRTFPAPHSETCDTFRAAEASALRTGSGRVSLVNLDIHGLPSGKFIPQHMPEHRPAGVGNGFCHPCLFELGGVHIADSDQTVFSRQFGTGDVKMMTASIGNLSMDSLGAPSVAGPLSDGELLLVLPVVAKSRDFLTVAACGERLEAEVDTNLAIACDEVIFDLALEGDIPPPASVLDEGAGLERPIDLARLPETEPALEINDGITINLECARDERDPAKRTFGAKAGSKTWAAAVDIARSNELTANRLRRVGVQSEFGSASRCQLDQIKCSRPASSHSSFPAPLSLSLGSDAKIPNLIARDREFFELPARRSVFDAEFSREDHVENIPPRDFAHKSHNHTSEDEQMTKPSYTIGKDEMLLITVRWNDGDTVLLETPVKFYTAEEIQSLIDETVSERCDVVGVDRYEMVRRVGESIADEFDVRTWGERVTDDRRELAADDNLSVQVAYNAMRNSFGLVRGADLGGQLVAAE